MSYVHVKDKLGLKHLTLLVIGGIVGSGIFSLPQNMAEGAGAGAILIAWGITLIGMFCLSSVFHYLSLRFKLNNDGLYGYVRKGFGDYIGFNAAWGYWISAWMTCGSYLVILFNALGSFDLFHLFSAKGSTLTLSALFAGLMLLWVYHFFVLRGVYTAALLNSLVTLAKIVPIGLFIICVMLAFNIKTFTLKFWGNPALPSLLQQVENTMLYTVWVYLGIESATIYASRAKRMLDVGRATVLGFVITSILLICVSVFSLGVVPQEELATMENPSMAGVLERVVGYWGVCLINIGLIISVCGALLSWLMLAAEMLHLTGKGEKPTSPRLLGSVNRAGTPHVSLWLSTICISVMLFVAYYSRSGYNTLIQLSTSMVLIPYFLSALFVFKLSFHSSKKRLKLLGIMSSIYGIWLIYAGGTTYLLLSMILYSLGLVIYYKARKEQKLPLFSNNQEKGYAIFIVVMGMLALLYFS